MPTLTIDRFERGIDRRKLPVVSDANRLVQCKNAYVTTGRSIRKRPGLSRITTLEPGTAGLVSAGGRLNTFHGGERIITHADERFRAHWVPHPSGYALTRVPFGTQFAGYLYVVGQ